MIDKICLVLAVQLIAALPQHLHAQLPELSAGSLESYQIAIEPTADETEFLQINWNSQLHRAVRKAHESEKPLLIYVMNGHPLGCT